MFIYFRVDLFRIKYFDCFVLFLVSLFVLEVVMRTCGCSVSIAFSGFPVFSFHILFVFLISNQCLRGSLSFPVSLTVFYFFYFDISIYFRSRNIVPRAVLLDLRALNQCSVKFVPK